MDPIAAATGAVPLAPAQPTAPANEATPAANDAPTEGVTGGEAQLSDRDMQRYTAVAAGFVQQMYMTMWREAQRNSGN